MSEAGRIDLYLPILVPLATALAAAFVGKLPRTRRAISVVGSAVLLACGLWLVIQVRQEGVIASNTGSWPAPFGITLVADLLSAVLVVVTGGIGLAVTTFSVVDIDPLRERGGFHSLVHLLLMGVCGAFLTGDLFNLYVWFEVMLVSSFILMALGGTRSQMGASIHYVTLNLLASALFLAGTGILYGMVGTLNMADVSVRMRDLAGTPYPYILAALFLVAFGIKAAAFPLFFWLPASYHTPPIAVTTLFSALLTKVGVYAIIRMTTLVFAAQADTVRPILLAVAGLTMVTGVLGAIAQGEMRRLLAFHIVSQIGYLLMGVGLGIAARAGRDRLLLRPRDRREIGALHGHGHRPLAAPDVRPGEPRRARKKLAPPGRAVPRPCTFARRSAAVLGVLGEVRDGQGRSGRRQFPDRDHGVARERPDARTR